MKNKFQYYSLARPKLVLPGTPLANRLMSDPHWIAQEKVDGTRVLVEVVSGKPPRVTSRHGNSMWEKVNSATQSWLRSLSGSAIVDAELHHGQLYCFDYLTEGLHQSLNGRLMMLSNFLADAPWGIGVCPAVREGKQEFYNEVVGDGGEGVVLKCLQDPYPPTCGAVWFKVKQ